MSITTNTYVPATHFVTLTLMDCMGDTTVLERVGYDSRSEAIYGLAALVDAHIADGFVPQFLPERERAFLRDGDDSAGDWGTYIARIEVA